MKKYILLTIVCVLFSQIINSFNLYTQELNDIDIQIIPLQGIYLTKYGYVVLYTTTDVRFGQIYLPFAWFQAKVGDENQSIKTRATKSYSNLNISAPQLKITYEDGHPKRIFIIVPQKFAETGTYPYSDVVLNNPRLENQEDREKSANDMSSLKDKFERQLNSDFIIFEEYRRSLIEKSQLFKEKLRNN